MHSARTFWVPGSRDERHYRKANGERAAMEGWSDGHLALFGALGKICEKIGSEAASDLAASITRPSTGFLVEEVQRLRKSSASVEDLQRTNERLQKTVDALLEELTVTRNSTTIDKNVTGAAQESSLSTVKKVFNASLAHEDLVNLSDGGQNGGCWADTKLPGNQNVVVDTEPSGHEYRKLVKKYNTLVKYSKSLSLARDGLEEKFREVLALTKDWVNYARALEKKISALKVASPDRISPLDKDPEELLAIKAITQPVLSLPRKVSAEVSNLGNQSPACSASSPGVSVLDGDTIVATPGDIRSVSGSGHAEEYETCQAVEHPDAIFSKLANRSATRSQSFNHSSSTQGEEECSDNPAHQSLVGDATINADLSSDSPIVLYSRSVRRRKNSHKGKEFAPIEPKVKVEAISSSPVCRIHLSEIECHESQDLDDIGEKYDTPKKKCRRLVQGDNSHLADRQLVDSNDCHTQQMDTPRRYDAEKAKPIPGPTISDPSVPGVHMWPLTSGKEVQKKRRRLDDYVQRSEHLFDSDNYFGADRLREPDPQVVEDKQALLAIGSENGSRPTDLLELSSPPKPNLARARISRPPIEESLVTQCQIPHRQEKATPSRQRVVDAGLGSKHLRVTRESMSKPGVLSAPSKGEPRTPEAKDSRPLRTRPLQELSLEHFKVNPKYNQGYDYAFSEVARGREQRRCLPGCTRPDCCGAKFQKFIELTRVPNRENGVSQEERDRHLLEEYMGDNRKKLRNMCESEREQAVIRAKAKELANKTGKHRQAYERRVSPPGFWRVDFPDTQERKEDRLEAARLEKELVQRRYEEAMRPGGKWIFRDE